MTATGTVSPPRRAFRRHRDLFTNAVVATVALLAGCTGGGGSGSGSGDGAGPAPSRPSVPPRLHVSGTNIVDAAGRTVRLLGVNRSGAEFECVNGTAIWDGPVDDASVTAMSSWGVRAVRVPLNEDCWLGSGKVHQEVYRHAVSAYVGVLEAHGMVPILDLHWSDGSWTGKASQCASTVATCQKPMPDEPGATAFWASVAGAFASDESVMFDLFNEPFPNATGTMSASQSWDCWLRGDTSCPGLGYRAAGMQQLVDAIRGTGARNVILVSGNGYASDLTGWLAHRPADPTGNLAAAWHSYSYDSCTGDRCWSRQVDQVASAVPVVAVEIGETDCAHGYVDGLMDWLDRRGIGYLGWAWNTWDCADGPALISDYDGTPTPYGSALRSRLRATS